MSEVGLFPTLKRAWKDMDKQLLISTFLLLIIGLLSIVSASSRETVSRYEYSTYHFFFKQLFMIVVGLVASIVILLIPTKYYYKFSFILWFAIIIVLIVMLLIVDPERGSVNWIPIPGIGKVQPSEFAKPILIVALSLLFEGASRKGYEKRDIYGINFLFRWAVIGCLIPIIVFIQGDLGTCLILFGISGIMFFASPISVKNKSRITLGLIGVLCVGLLGIKLVRGYLLTEEQYSRLNYFNPCARYEDDGYQVCNGLIAINNGGFKGLGIGKSQQKYSYIPDPHTDSIYTIIVEENGFVMGTIIIIIYMWMMFRIYRISRKANTARGKYLAFGALVYLALHVIFNLGGMLAVLPLTGVPLPLLSYGGSFTISFLCMIAIVQLVNIETKNKMIRISDKI